MRSLAACHKLRQMFKLEKLHIILKLNELSACAITGNSTTYGGVSNTRRGDLYSVPRGQAMSIYCDPRVYGRYLYVRRPGIFGVLTLCETAVYSESRRKFVITFAY